MTEPDLDDLLASAAGVSTPRTYDWTRDQVAAPLDYESVRDVADTIVGLLSAASVVVPDPDEFAVSCATALATGHLILQGPPGTGKTTVARIIAEAFGAELHTATATSDWSSFDVVGGLRPTETGALTPHLGCVSDAVLRCAANGRLEAGPPAWLLIDEMNRADIDKAFGQLFTVLSSSDEGHLQISPIDLWFETRDRRHLWVPRRFRMIATINDVDSSFVNSFSQGLSRRFQFVTLGVATDPKTIEAEVHATFSQAQGWYGRERNVTASDGVSTAPASCATKMSDLFFVLRDPHGVNWPIGTAQILDLWKSVLTSVDNTAENVDDQHLLALERGVRDRVVPQAATLDDERLAALEAAFEVTGGLKMPRAMNAVRRLRDAGSTY